VKTMREVLKKCPGKACDTPIDLLYARRQRHPELWGAALMACVESQADLLGWLWNERYPFETDANVHLAWLALCEIGEFPAAVNVSTPEAKRHADLMFRCALEGIQIARRRNS
jgi:hypothetical protein